MADPSSRPLPKDKNQPLTKEEKYTLVFNKTKILTYVSITLLICMCILRLI